MTETSFERIVIQNDVDSLILSRLSYDVPQICKLAQVSKAFRSKFKEIADKVKPYFLKERRLANLCKYIVDDLIHYRNYVIQSTSDNVQSVGDFSNAFFLSLRHSLKGSLLYVVWNKDENFVRVIAEAFGGNEFKFNERFHWDRCKHHTEDSPNSSEDEWISPYSKSDDESDASESDDESDTSVSN